MPKFTVEFTRLVTQADTFIRVIEAASEEEAIRLADQACSAFDSDCPDDATANGTDVCHAWEVGAVCSADPSAEVDEIPSYEW